MAEAGAWRAAVEDHGGSLERARLRFPGAPEPLLDLSTGINPHAYRFSLLPATAWTRLPEQGRQRQLEETAAAAYGAPSADHVVAAPGTQILLPLVAGLVAPGRARVLGPTYAEHARAAALARHAVEEVSTFDSLFGADLAIVVNPNNPDGRLSSRDRLLQLAAEMRARGGLLVVDEAFMDVGTVSESLCGDVGQENIVVLRSFGKFFGLAGLRLGFAVLNPEIASRLAGLFGPWSVSGPALEIGIAALGDTAWRDAMVALLEAHAARLDALLAHADIKVQGGTSLYRYVEFDDAPHFFDHCGHRGIALRDFAGRPRALRIGLPGAEPDWSRLARALDEWKEATP